MKADIHPQYTEIKVTCSCGNSFLTRSALGKEELFIEVCSKCHPFYTGKQKLVDTAGRVERFVNKYANQEEIQQKIAAQQQAAKQQAASQQAVATQGQKKAGKVEKGAKNVIASKDKAKSADSMTAPAAAKAAVDKPKVGVIKSAATKVSKESKVNKEKKGGREDKK